MEKYLIKQFPSDTALWSLERPANDQLTAYPLPDYQSVTMTEAGAVGALGQDKGIQIIVGQNDGGTLYNMQDQNGDTLSTVAENPQLTFTYTGPR